MAKIKKLTMWLLIIVTLFTTGCGRQSEDTKDVFIITDFRGKGEISTEDD